MVMNSEQIECPVCGQYANIHDLGRAGLTVSELQQLNQYISGGILSKMLHIAEMVERRIDPASTSMELSFSETLERIGSNQTEKLDQVTRLISGISEKIVGPGMGEVAEIIAAQEFSQTFSKDEFDTSKADKHGTDIIATVFDKQSAVGKISISIKDTKTWKNEFLQQLEKNTSQDNAKIGILISKKLPRRSNPKGEVIHNNGRMFFLVTPQFGVASYAALRQVIINLHSTQQFIEDKEKELIKIGKISKALAKWITGDEYCQILETLKNINQNSEKSREELIGLQEHVDRKVKKVCDRQTATQRELLNTESLLSGLKELLMQTKEDMK